MTAPERSGSGGVRGPAVTVRLGAFGVMASAKREVGAPCSGGVVVVVRTATGGVADIAAAGVEGWLRPGLAPQTMGYLFDPSSFQTNQTSRGPNGYVLGKR